jgi:hypothetical protein
MNPLDGLPLQAIYPPEMDKQHTRHVYAHQFAQELYQKARERAGWQAVWAWLWRRPRHLADLNAIREGLKCRGSHPAGIRLVPIRRIIGSEGRRGDFDRQFNPLNRGLKARWQSVAIARYQGVVLPLVELIQIGDDYFVRDGHHRLSVARTLGQDDIEALVTVWEVSRPLPAAALPNGACCPEPQLQVEGA